MRQRLARAWNVFDRWVRRPFPLTGLGILVGVGSMVGTVYYGLRRLDLVLLVIGIVGLAVTALALVATLLGALIIRRADRRRQMQTEGAKGKPHGKLQIECGFPVRTGFSLPRPWYLPFVDVSWRWLEPEAAVRIIRRGSKYTEEVTAARRGMVPKVVRLVEVGDIFGLTQLSFELHEVRQVRFTPSVGALKHIEVIRGMSGGDDLSHPSGPAEGDPFDMRRYNPGDPIRFVLWKVFARSRMLVVRTPERAISLARQTAAYMVATKGDEPAAGAARVAVDHGVLGNDWILGVDGSDQVATAPGLALEMLTRSSNADPERGGTGLADFLRNRVPSDMGRAVVFVPGRPGPWLETVQAAARSKRGGVEFVVCTDGIKEPPQVSAWRRWLVPTPEPEVAPGATEPVTRAEVTEVVKALGGSRAKVVVIDRAAGRVFTAAHLEGMKG